jgi:Fic family protein
MSANALQRQLENTRFDRALEVAEGLAEHRALLTTAELERMNNILTGRGTDQDPWRKAPVTLTLPSGKTETLALIADPKMTTREKLHRSTEIGEATGNAVEAAVAIYAGVVLSHPFEDANRRTAALAAHYFLHRYGAPLSGRVLHELGLGDLREPGQIDALKETIHGILRFKKR